MGDVSGGSDSEAIRELEILNELGWTYEELATVADVQKMTLYGYKRDGRVPVRVAHMIHNFFVQQTEKILCIHNRGVNCAERNCERCGWNPTIAEERINKWREQQFGQLKSLKSVKDRTVTYDVSSRTILVRMTSKS